MTYEISIDGKAYRLELEQVEGAWKCRLDSRDIAVDAVLPAQRSVPSDWQ